MDRAALPAASAAWHHRVEGRPPARHLQTRGALLLFAGGLTALALLPYARFSWVWLHEHHAFGFATLGVAAAGLVGGSVKLWRRPGPSSAWSLLPAAAATALFVAPWLLNPLTTRHSVVREWIWTMVAVAVASTLWVVAREADRRLVPLVAAVVVVIGAAVAATARVQRRLWYDGPLWIPEAPASVLLVVAVGSAAGVAAYAALRWIDETDDASLDEPFS